MSAPAKRKSRAKGKKKERLGWYAWWPVALGILVTPFTMRFAGVLALKGPEGMRLLYPYVELMQQKALGLSADQGAQWAQIMMYLQFPMYGLFLMLINRRRDFVGALMMTGVIHFVVVIVLLGLSQMQTG